MITIEFFFLISKSALGPPKAKQPGLTHYQVATVHELTRENVWQISKSIDVKNPQLNDVQFYELAGTVAELRKRRRNNKKKPEWKAIAFRANELARELLQAEVDLSSPRVDFSSLKKKRRCNPSSISISPIQVNDAGDRLAQSQRRAFELILVLLETGWIKSYQRRSKLMRLDLRLRRRAKSLRTSERALASRRASRRAKRRGHGTP